MPAGRVIDISRALAGRSGEVIVAATEPLAFIRSARTTYPVTGDPLAAAAAQFALALTVPPTLPDVAVTRVTAARVAVTR